MVDVAGEQVTARRVVLCTVALVRALDVALDDAGFVRVDPMTRETSVPGDGGRLTERFFRVPLHATLGYAARMNVAPPSHERTR